MKLLIIFIMTFVFAGNVIAETSSPFKISRIYMSGASNFHFRVMSTGGWHCYNGPTNPSWSYINENDDGAKGKMAVLLSAYVAGKTVSLVTRGVDTSMGHVCQILDFTISD